MSMIGVIKRLVKQRNPDLFHRAKRYYRQYRFRRGHGGSEYRAVTALSRQYGKRVLNGPFRGMRYGDAAFGSAYVAKILGSYEEELHSVLHPAIVRAPCVVANVGCAEGYYAVGLAIRLPNATVYAYDIDPDARMYCRELAELNGVSDRVIVCGACGHAELMEIASQRTLIVCDCEGYELQLLDPRIVPCLSECDILVELHEFLSPGLTETIVQRFQRTHSVRLIDTRERDVNDYPELECVRAADRPWAVREGRPASMQWAYLCPLTMSGKAS